MKQPSSEMKRMRLCKIVRLIDRLMRKPADATWQQRARRIHREISSSLERSQTDVRASSHWAAI